MSPTALHLISTGGFYGAERVVVELSAWLLASGWNARIGVLDSPGASLLREKAEAAGVPCDPLPGSLKSFRSTCAAIRRWAASHDASLVHAHGYKTDVLALLALRSAGTPLVATCHSWYSDNLKLKLYEKLDKWALRQMQGVVAVSGPILDDLHASGIATARTRLITNGIAPPSPPGRSREAILAELGIPADAHLLLRIGRLDINKGNHHLLTALADLSDNCRLLLVGDGPERDALAARARDLGIADRVLMPGYRADIPDLLAAADVMVISSTKEGLPIVLLEAMAARIPLVVTAVGMIPDLISDGDTGWVVPPGDAAPLRDALTHALGAPEARRRRADAAQALYRQAYSREAMGAQYVDLYNAILSPQGSAQ